MQLGWISELLPDIVFVKTGKYIIGTDIDLVP